MRTTPVRGHNRSRPYEKQRLAMTDRLWNEYVGEVLALDLAVKLSEPLDDPQFDDMSEEWKREQREIW